MDAYKANVHPHDKLATQRAELFSGWQRGILLVKTPLPGVVVK
jgi:hypothetical protein